jgi:lysozyme
MKTSEAGKTLIKSFENLELKAYPCPSGILTIGWGHTAGVEEGMVITRETAERFLEEDIARVEAALPNVLHSPLGQGQWDALVSLTFNLRGGPQRLPKIAPKLVAALNSQDYETAAREFLDINKANGEVLAGLTRRRKAEVELFSA